MMSNKLIVSVVFFLLISSIVVAQEDFTFTTPSELDLCPCSNQAYPITIHNTGSQTSTFSVYATGQAADWTRFNPSQVTLAPNEATVVFGFVDSVCNIAGQSSLDLFVSTETGLTRGFSQVFTFNNCYDYSIALGEPVQEADDVVDFDAQTTDYMFCQDQQAFIPILIENNEQFGNRYSIFMDAPEWVTLQTSTATLQQESSGIALIAVDTADVEEGDFELKINAISQLGKVQRKEALDITVGNCLDFVLDIVDDTIQVCEDQTKIVDVTLTNNGAIAQQAELSVEGSVTARLQDTTFTIDPKETVETTLFVFSQDNDFELTLEADLDNLPVAFADTVDVEVISAEACYEPKIDTKTSVRNSYEQDVFAAIITNNGADKITYQVSLSGADWASVVPRTLTLDPEEDGNLNIAINPPESVDEGTYALSLELEANGQTYTELIDVRVSKSNAAAGAVADTIGFYKYYIYAAIVLIVLIIVIAFFIRRRKDRDDSEEEVIVEEKPKKTVKKTARKKASKKVDDEEHPAVPKKVFAWIAVGFWVFVVILAVAFLDILQPVKDFFNLYAWYILAAIVILILFVVAARFTGMKKYFEE